MFDDYFDVYLADTPEGKKEHFKLRYKVYCEEMGYEGTNCSTPEQEIDKWDDHAVHFLVRHRESKQWIGAMRLVFQQDGSLPLKELCKIDPWDNCNRHIEISRLCLIENIRKRKSDIEPPLGICNNDLENSKKNVTELFDRRRIQRSLIWGLIRAASIYSSQRNVDKWYFLCTKALARVLSAGGLHLTKVGDACNHRGERYPFKLDVSNVLSNPWLKEEFKNGYRLYSDLQRSDQLLDNAA